jgi:hypothetical protein
MKDKFYNNIKEVPKFTVRSLLDYIHKQNYSDCELDCLINSLITDWAMDKKSYRLIRVIRLTAAKLEGIHPI